MVYSAPEDTARSRSLDQNDACVYRARHFGAQVATVHTNPREVRGAAMPQQTDTPPSAFANDTLSKMEEILRRVQGEFLEMPGLRLTEAQARRLWGLEADTCAALLDALIASRFLFRTRDGAFMRIEHATPVKAGLPARRISPPRETPSHLPGRPTSSLPPAANSQRISTSGAQIPDRAGD